MTTADCSIGDMYLGCDEDEFTVLDSAIDEQESRDELQLGAKNSTCVLHGGCMLDSISRRRPTWEALWQLVGGAQQTGFNLMVRATLGWSLKVHIHAVSFPECISGTCRYHKSSLKCLSPSVHRQGGTTDTRIDIRTRVHAHAQVHTHTHARTHARRHVHAHTHTHTQHPTDFPLQTPALWELWCCGTLQI